MIAVYRILLMSCVVVFGLSIPATAEPTLPANADALVEKGIAAYDAEDYQRAKDILLPLAEAGHGKAMNIIGLMHSKGKGFVPNRKTACDLYERSAITGYASAQCNLGICYMFGNGRPENHTLAIQWYHQAAEQGYKRAQAALAVHYKNIDREQYLYWAQKASEQGSIRAQALLWSRGDKHLVPELSMIDLACYVIAVGLLDKPHDYCD